MNKPSEINEEPKDIESLVEDFIKTINYWIDELEQYEMHQLTLKPDDDSWSIGQLYCHLVDETKFYFSEIENCLSNNDNQFESKTTRAIEQFKNNSFPNERFKGPADIDNQPQPESRPQLKDEFERLKDLVNEVGGKISISTNKGKTKHPGHDYLSAKEWFQYAEMHLRHHLRQKERIDSFLKNRSYS